MNRFYLLASILLMGVSSPLSHAEIKVTARSFLDRTGFEITLTADPNDLQLMAWTAPNGRQSGVTILGEGGFHLFFPVTFDEALVHAIDGTNVSMSRAFQRAAEFKLRSLQDILLKIRANGDRAAFRSYVNQNSVINGKLMQKSLIVNGIFSERGDSGGVRSTLR